MALGTFRPGVHSATYNSAAVGLTTGDGFTLRWRRSRIPINNTGTYGQTLIDGIYTGVTGVQLITTLKEINAAVQAIIWPWGASAAFDGTHGTAASAVGNLDSALAKVLVLTPAASSPAVTNAPVSTGILTANLAILSPDNDAQFLFGPVETDIPVVFDLLLYDDSGTKRFFKWS